MFPSSIYFRDFCFVLDLNFTWLKLVLECSKTQRTVLSLTPTVDGTFTATEETCIASTCDLLDLSDWDVFDEYWRIFESYRIIYA